MHWLHGFALVTVCFAQVPSAAPTAESGTPKQLDDWWADLASADARRAYAAIWKLIAASDEAVRLIKERFQPAKEVDSKRVDQLITDLDNDKSAIREKASKELETMGAEAWPAMRRALAEKPSDETKQRLEVLLALPPVVRDPEVLRALRAIQVLEHIGRPEARRVLETMAKGAAKSRITEDAKASLARLGRRD